jgi:hypothetical protein
MSTAADYAPDEWKLIVSAPMLAGLLVSAADVSGPIGLIKEGLGVVESGDPDCNKRFQ